MAGNLKSSAVRPQAQQEEGPRLDPLQQGSDGDDRLRYDVGNSARCVEVGILTCARSQEVRWMEWDELDFDKKTWLIPGAKMKIKGEQQTASRIWCRSRSGRRDHRRQPRVGKYVFPSDAKQMATIVTTFPPNALTSCLRRITDATITMHGMRTTFRNWGADSREHNFRREVLEFCLSHRVGDEAEQSYWTSDMLDRRAR